MDVQEVISVRIAKAAELIGVSASAMNMWRHTGQGPKYAKLGRIVVYPIDELKKFLDERRVYPTGRTREK